MTESDHERYCTPEEERELEEAVGEPLPPGSPERILARIHTANFEALVAKVNRLIWAIRLVAFGVVFLAIYTFLTTR